MISKKVKRVISMVLVLLMVSSSMVFAQGSDYEGHWAASSIRSWVDKGYVKGYADGSFKPENEITRAEFISIVNRSFEFTEQAEVSYTDVQASHWAYEEFERASAAGYIGGFEDGTLRPNSEITRQEVAAIISRLLDLSDAPKSEAFLGLDDVDQIPEWSAGVVSAVVDKGYMNLRDGNFDGASPATRAEVISALDKGYLNLTKVKYDEAGTYTAGVVDGSVEITVKDVILEDTTINGNLIISEGVGSGDVTLKNVVVKGNTIVNGGGMDTITIEDSQIATLIVNKKDGKVRILAVGTTDVDNVELQSGAKLESKDKEANNFGKVVIAEKLVSDEPIILDGNFENVEINSGSNAIKVLGGTIKNLVIAETAKDAKVNLAEGVKVERLEVNAPATVDGKGKIDKAVVNVDGVVIAAPTTTMETADGVEVKTEVPSTGGGGSSDGGSSTVTGIKVQNVELRHFGKIDELAVALSEVPKTTPTALSVKVTRTIDGKNDDSFKWSVGKSDWNAENKVLTISDIESVKATDADQVVYYTVSYGNTAGVRSNKVVVEKGQPVDPEVPGKGLVIKGCTDTVKVGGTEIKFTVTTETAIFVTNPKEVADKEITLIGNDPGFEVKIKTESVSVREDGKEMTFLARFTNVNLVNGETRDIEFKISEGLFTDNEARDTQKVKITFEAETDESGDDENSGVGVGEGLSTFVGSSGTIVEGALIKFYVSTDASIFVSNENGNLSKLGKVTLIGDDLGFKVEIEQISGLHDQVMVTVKFIDVTGEKGQAVDVQFALPEEWFRNGYDGVKYTQKVRIPFGAKEESK